MGIFRQFPYTNFHEMNMDQIIKIVKDMLDDWAHYYTEWDNWKEQVTQEWAEMQTWISTYFDNLDVQQEINNKISNMVTSGEFSAIVDPYVPPAVSAWLAQHITQPTNLALDTSLTVAGAAADSKAAGDAITDLKSDSYDELPFAFEIENLTWTDGKYISHTTGLLNNNADWSASRYLALNPNARYQIVCSGDSVQWAIYDENKTYIRGGNGEKTFYPSVGEHYFRTSSPSTYKNDYKIIWDYETIMAESINSLINPIISWVDGKYRSSTTGNITNNSIMSYSSNIPVYPHDIIVTTEDALDHVCFFDKDGNFVSGTTACAFEIPDDCYFFCISILTSNKSGFDYYKNPASIHINKSVRELVLKLEFANNHGIDIFLYSGEYVLTNNDVSSLIDASGLWLGTNLFGIGNPVIKANRSSFSDQYSPINFGHINKSITLDGISIECNNCRYCIHDEMGYNHDSADNYYSHKISNCKLIQNTQPQTSFPNPRSIGIGLGNNGYILIENCVLSSNAISDIDAHSGYDGQLADSIVFVKDCICEDNTISATSGHVSGNYKNTMIVTNCLVNAPVVKNIQEFDGIDLIEYNNHISQ